MIMGGKKSRVWERKGSYGANLQEADESYISNLSGTLPCVEGKTLLLLG